jgi:acetyl-CoA carboxylase biotin carboxyl carrier protein
LSEKKRKTKPRSASPAGGKTTTAGAAGPMNVDFLQQLVNLMASNDLNTVDLRDSDRRIVLKRGVAAAAPSSSGPVQSAPSHYVPPAPTPPPPTPSAPVDEDAGLMPIKSPMVGTFYAASSPDAKPFVHVGSVVDEETDVCVIEAMKVFNNIKAETRGTIARICVTNGQTVEFGTVIFLVKPS